MIAKTVVVFLGSKYTLKTSIFRISAVKLAWIHCVDEIPNILWLPRFLNPGPVQEPWADAGGCRGQSWAAALCYITCRRGSSPYSALAAAQAGLRLPNDNVLYSLAYLTTVSLYWNLRNSYDFTAFPFMNGFVLFSSFLPSPRKLLRVICISYWLPLISIIITMHTNSSFIFPQLMLKLPQ